ncbi:MAG: leucyl aminopeptidase family protein, partial [Acetobacteraceae bacterium]|nr:leucyl aminopeptidase family protein [Acetobacteraceae bacterium]
GAQAEFLQETGFRADTHELACLPAEGGVGGAVLGLGEDYSPYAFGGLAFRLPEGRPWRLEAGDYDTNSAVLGYCLGAYRYGAFKSGKRAPARLIAPAGSEPALIAATATWMVRDLINTPANVLGPDELADSALYLARRFGASGTRVTGEALERAYPMIWAVGRGSARRPVVARFDWTSPDAGANAPLISLCGKGVCFDTGGYDLKPSAGMLRMKKDMGGAATTLGLARMIMEAQIPVRLAVRVGCVENSVSGSAMRPSDVIRTRHGLSVEIGNTDAEGRLVLCDLLAEASQEKPDLLLDCATLTGAARVALGPDLPALFSNNETWSERLLSAGRLVHDPLWRLPLWDGYDSWLDSQVADLNNVSSKPTAGAVIAALFLRRFINADVSWAHIDLYAWNDQTQPGRPEGGEAQSMRAAFAAINEYVIAGVTKTGR